MSAHPQCGALGESRCALQEVSTVLINTSDLYFTFHKKIENKRGRTVAQILQTRYNNLVRKISESSNWEHD